MATNESNQPQHNPDDANQPQGEGQNIDNLQHLKDFPKEDLLNMEKGAAAMDKLGGHPEPIEGKTTSGSGSGPGTGDWGGDFDRPGTDGSVPPQNDFVQHELPEDLNQDGTDAGYRDVTTGQELPIQDLARAEDVSDSPGSGAVRTSEDRVPPGREKDDSFGFSPEEPANQPRNPGAGGA